MWLEAAAAVVAAKKLIGRCLESMPVLDPDLGNLGVNYGLQRHKAFDAVYTTLVKGGHTAVFTDWKQIKAQ